VIGSIEGRTSVKYFDYSVDKRNDEKSFCFKCHRVEDKSGMAGMQQNQSNVVVYSVNGFAFNRKYQTFFSYGADGVYVTWNKDTRAKYRSSPAFPSPIVAGD